MVATFQRQGKYRWTHNRINATKRESITKSYVTHHRYIGNLTIKKNFIFFGRFYKNILTSLTHCFPIDLPKLWPLPSSSHLSSSSSSSSFLPPGPCTILLDKVIKYSLWGGGRGGAYVPMCQSEYNQASILDRMTNIKYVQNRYRPPPLTHR